MVELQEARGRAIETFHAIKVFVENKFGTPSFQNVILPYPYQIVSDFSRTLLMKSTR
jgi:hypothetical protein